MSKRRWFRFHVDRWFNGTFGLTPNEIAAYITVLCELYDSGGTAPMEFDIMARRCGMRPSSFTKAIDRLVALEKLEIKDGLLTSQMVLDEIEESENSAKSRAKVGEKSEKTQLKLVQNAPENAIKTSEIEKNAPVYKNTDNRIQNITPDKFDDFWTAFPRKIAKGAARRAFKTALKKTTPETLVDGARRYARDRAGKDDQYTKHPASWLNGECWEDAVPKTGTADFGIARNGYFSELKIEPIRKEGTAEERAAKVKKLREAMGQ